MPYRHAHLYLVALILLALVAFWPGYFGTLGAAPWGMHLHGLTATGWLLLLAAQSWSIHDRRIGMHRALGRASLFYFPLFLAGAAAVLLSMARATPTHPLYQVYGDRLAAMDGPGLLLLAWLFHRAIATRRQPRRHAAYLLSTPLVLLPPVLGRIVPVPAFLTAVSAEPIPSFGWSVRIGAIVAVAIAAILYARAPRDGLPFLVTAVALAVFGTSFDTVGHSAAWAGAMRWLARQPDALVLGAAALLGALAAWSGWVAGQPRRSAATAAVAAT